MSLGPYNNDDFITTQERQKQEQITLEKKEAENHAQVKAFKKRQKILKQEQKEAKKQRVKQKQEQKLKLEKENKERLFQEEQRQLHQEKVKRQIDENFRIQAEEEREKEIFEQKYLAEQQKLQEVIDKKNTLKSSDSNLILTPEQADITINNPDDIETELANVQRLRYLLLYSSQTPQFIKDYILLLDKLNKKYNLDFAFAYRGIAQAELDSSSFGGGGKYDITMRYRPTEQTHFALRLDGRHQVGQYSSTEFKDKFGSLTSTSASYRKEDIHLAQLWLQHTQGDFVLRAGKIDPSSFIDSHLFKSNSRFFLNGTFSTSPYNSYPANGIGFAGKYEKQEYYLTAEITDANGVRDEINSDFFTEKKFYCAVEFGITPKNGSKYHITAWNRDSSEKKEDEAKGFIASAVQVLDSDTHLIIRGATSDNAKAKRYASLGLGKFSLFQEHDISGLAIGTLVPSDENGRTQTSIESFYRIDPIPGVQLSADLQFIYHPSKGEQTWAILPGVRLRVLF